MKYEGAAALFLVIEVDAMAIEGPVPFLPVDTAQPAVPGPEVDPQYAQMIRVLRDCGGAQVRAYDARGRHRAG
jgi:hypothetical protein